MNTKYLFAVSLVAGLAASAKADPVTYTDWTAAGPSGVSSTAGGTLALSDGTVNVSYSGEIAFAQINDTGTQYWTQPNASLLPYTGNAVVGNAPSSPDIIALEELSPTEKNTLTFSQPVHNPIMLINSLGQGGDPVSYIFDTPFTLLGAGQGYFGGNASTLTATGETLTGTEGAGAIEFLGDISEISWTTDSREYWNGFTIGAVTEQDLVPTTPDGGATLGMMGVGLAALLAFRRKK